MKKIVFVLISLVLSAGVFAQATESKKADAPVIKAETKYCCPKCDYCSSKEGTCPHHKATLMKSETETMYCCTNCGFKMSPVKGKCPQSTVPLTKDGELKCVTCHHKAGKCPKCSTEMSPVEVPKMKMKEKKR